MGTDTLGLCPKPPTFRMVKARWGQLLKILNGMVMLHSRSTTGVTPGMYIIGVSFKGNGESGLNINPPDRLLDKFLVRQFCINSD